MSDLLYLYCGGNKSAVLELIVSLYSLTRSNPSRTFDVGVGLDEESSQWFDADRAKHEWGITCRVLEETAACDGTLGDHGRHIINRWRALQLFQFERAIILDIDTIVNRSLDELYRDIHPEPDFFTTFVRFWNDDRKWGKHVPFYDATGTNYPPTPLYCSIGMHAIHRDWPHFQRMDDYLHKMGEFKLRSRIRRVFIDEYSINLISLQNGGKVHFPFQAIRKGKKASLVTEEDTPHVWHFILGRTHCNPFWREMCERALEVNFLQARRLM